MNMEIERKFLVKNDSWKTDDLHGEACRQGYLFANEKKTVRVRQIGEKGFLTIKGETLGISRKEFEYEIPFEDASALLLLCGDFLIEKRRYKINYANMLWEVDLFLGENEGLVLAEIELESEGQSFVLPPWVGKEVSNDFRYFNAQLARHPFRELSLSECNQ